MDVELAWQGSLLALGEPCIDPAFGGVVRTALGPDADAWVDHVPGWVRGADALFATLLEGMEWQGRTVHMYERILDQPRLTARLRSRTGVAVVEEMRRALSARYGIEFTGVGFNLYRDGRDSVAWHGDRVARDLPEAIVAIVSLGGRRRFLLRPHGGGRSVGFDPGPGDLLVMGGSCQRTWQHAVPKAARAEPRISVTFRHAYEKERSADGEAGREPAGAVDQLHAGESRRV